MSADWKRSNGQNYDWWSILRFNRMKNKESGDCRIWRTVTKGYISETEEKYPGTEVNPTNCDGGLSSSYVEGIV